MGWRVVLKDGGGPQPAGWGPGPRWSLGRGSLVPGRGAEQGVNFLQGGEARRSLSAA